MEHENRLSALADELRRSGADGRRVGELAARFEVTTRTILRDVMALRAQGELVSLRDGTDDCYVIEPPPEPLELTRAETAAVTVALSLAEAGDQWLIHAGSSALIKLTSVLDDESRARVNRYVQGAIPQLPDWSELREVVEDGLRDNHAVVLEYADDRGATSRRLVDPMKFVRAKGRWYLVAWCLERDAMRSFRWDRVHGATPSDRPTGP